MISAFIRQKIISHSPSRIVGLTMRSTQILWFYLTAIIYFINPIRGDEPKIIIVGAGCAGLAAATKLYENGFNDITILEAENRIGGRVHTIMFGGMSVDLGAQWVHGQINNTVFELAWPLGILEVPEDFDGTFLHIYDSEGHQIPISISQNLMELYIEIQDEIDEGVRGRDDSIGDYFMERLNNSITSGVEKFSEVNDTMWKSVIKLFENFEISEDSADSWYDISAKGYMESQTCPGSNVVNWKDKGYGTVIDILLKKFPNPEKELPVMNNTLLNTEVTNINYSSTEGKVLVETNTGNSYTADHVIVTLSLGVLKEHYQTLFTPELPDSKVNSIKGLSIGTVAKLYYYYETPWWPNNTNFAFLWSESERREYEHDPDKKWLLDLFVLTSLPHKPRILCGWMSGPGVRYMESLPEDQVLNQTLTLFQKFFGNSYNIGNPTEFLRTNWYSNVHFRGTYSFRSMESEKVNATARQLSTPLLDVNGKPIVMFAGEATDSFYFANVHGAIDTGYREADRLIELYKSIS